MPPEVLQIWPNNSGGLCTPGSWFSPCPGIIPLPHAHQQSLEQISCGLGITSRGVEWCLCLKSAGTACLWAPARPFFPSQSLSWEKSPWTELAPRDRCYGPWFHKTVGLLFGLAVSLNFFYWSQFPSFFTGRTWLLSLESKKGLRNHFHCLTLSSFGWLLVSTWALDFFFFFWKQSYCPDFKMTKYRFEISPKYRFLLSTNLFKRTVLTGLPSLSSPALSLGTKFFLPYSSSLGFFPYI